MWGLGLGFQGAKNGPLESFFFTPSLKKKNNSIYGNDNMCCIYTHLREYVIGSSRLQVPQMVGVAFQLCLDGYHFSCHSTFSFSWLEIGINQSRTKTPRRTNVWCETVALTKAHWSPKASSGAVVSCQDPSGGCWVNVNLSTVRALWFGHSIEGDLRVIDILKPSPPLFHPSLHHAERLLHHQPLT